MCADLFHAFVILDACIEHKKFTTTTRGVHTSLVSFMHGATRNDSIVFVVACLTFNYIFRSEKEVSYK